MFSLWVFLGHFIKFVRFGKNGSCAGMGVRVPKMVLSQLSWRIQIRWLENPHRRHFVKLGDFNKTTEKLALPVVRTVLPILDNFQIFAKVPYHDEKYASEVAKPSRANYTWDRAKFCVRMGPSAPNNGFNSITATGSIMSFLKTCLAVPNRAVLINWVKKPHLLIVRVISPILDKLIPRKFRKLIMESCSNFKEIF